MSAIEFDLTDAGVRAEFHAGQLKVQGFQVDVPCVLDSDRHYHRVTFDIPRGHVQREYISAIHFTDTAWPRARYNVRVEITGAVVSDEFWWDQRERSPEGGTRYVLKAARRG